MKKIRLFLTLLCTISFITSSAQFNKLEIGVEAGPAIVSLRGNEFTEKYHKAKISYAAGIFFQYNLKKNLSLHVGLSYDNKGSKIESEIFDNLGDSIGMLKGHTYFHYLNLPLLMKVSFGKKNKFFVNAGPYISYLLRQTSRSKVDSSEFLLLDNTRMDKRLDLGISLGCGLSIPVSQQFNFLLEIRDNLGLYNTSAVPIVNGGSIKQNSLNFLFGISCKLGSYRYIRVLPKNMGGRR
jgi:hypothetical protein